MYDVVALGELLVDFVPGDANKASTVFIANPGGAPANVLATLAKMGRRTAFIGKVGDDQFGSFLKQTLVSCGIDTCGLVLSENVNTTLAFVHLKEDGDRTFSFYRNPGADRTLAEEEVRLDLIRGAGIFHFGSVSLTHEPVRTSTLRALEYAKQSGALISYDPNLRLPLWNSPEEAFRLIRQCLLRVDVLKVSEEELTFLTGQTDLEKGTKDILDEFSVQLIFVTLGANGCFYRLHRETGHVPAPRVDTIDTTGTGDVFVGSMLHKIVALGSDISHLSVPEIEECIQFANVVAALSTTKKGGITSIPSVDEIDAFMRHANFPICP